jgi:anti-anti-sigma regulatory factor
MTDDERTGPPAIVESVAFTGAPGVEHVAVLDDLCRATAGELERVLVAPLLEALVIVLDLSAVTVLDAASARLIRAVETRLRRERRRLVVIAPDSLRGLLARSRATRRSSPPPRRIRGGGGPARQRHPTVRSRRATCQ